jgi:hypothetical protein
MLDDKDMMLGEIFKCLGGSLDIPPSKYKQAVERYEAVGRHLEGGVYSYSIGTPAIYPQGSFRLGTITRPFREGKDADYDIDLVCDIRSVKTKVTPTMVKREVGDRLKTDKNYQRMLDKEGRRCWTLEYADEEDGVGFHLDVLPAIPEASIQRLLIEAIGVSSDLTQHSIAITDRLDSGEYNWDPSNPMGYGLWFDIKNKVMFDQVATLQKRMIVESTSVYASVDQVPDQLVRTPLQRLIQILKRHRDVSFDGKSNSKEKPISIIITTLAAEAYKNESDPWLALEALIKLIEGYQASNIIRKRDGKWYIPNPTNFEENFADRWDDDGGVRADAFFEWVGHLRQDLLSLRSVGSISELKERMNPLFGESQVNAAFTKFGKSLEATSSAGKLSMVSSGLLGTVAGIPIQKHNFYAD